MIAAKQTFYVILGLALLLFGALLQDVSEERKVKVVEFNMLLHTHERVCVVENRNAAEEKRWKNHGCEEKFNFINTGVFSLTYGRFVQSMTCDGLMCELIKQTIKTVIPVALPVTFVWTLFQKWKQVLNGDRDPFILREDCTKKLQ